MQQRHLKLLFFERVTIRLGDKAKQIDTIAIGYDLLYINYFFREEFMNNRSTTVPNNEENKQNPEDPGIHFSSAVRPSQSFIAAYEKQKIKPVYYDETRDLYYVIHSDSENCSHASEGNASSDNRSERQSLKKNDPRLFAQANHPEEEANFKNKTSLPRLSS